MATDDEHTRISHRLRVHTCAHPVVQFGPAEPHEVLGWKERALLDAAVWDLPPVRLSRFAYEYKRGPEKGPGRTWGTQQSDEWLQPICIDNRLRGLGCRQQAFL